MTDVVSPVEETKPSSPELQAQAEAGPPYGKIVFFLTNPDEEVIKRQKEAQQIQMLESEIVRGRRMLTITCLNLANLAINLLPRPEQGEETTKGKKNPQKRMLTLSDLDKVSAIVERLTQASAHLSAGGSSMMRGPTMR